jgi:superfamily II DNA or RNA helicase
MILRPFQSSLLDQVHAAWTQHRAVCLQSPTGSGKTVVFTHLAEFSAQRVLIIAHRSEILDQISQHLSVDHGHIRAGMPTSDARIQIASIQTLARRTIDPPDLIILDECHHAMAPSFRSVLARFPEARILGVTATPERLDGKGLGEVFQHLILGPTTADLIAQNLLKRPVYYAPARGVDVSAVKKAMGDFAAPDLVRVMDTSIITGDAVDHYRRLGNGSPALGFAVNLDHARHTAEAFTAAGFPAEVIEGSMDAPARRLMKARLESGETRIIMSCELVSEGFDMPSVGCVILCRPTMSIGLHLQQIGRALRGSGTAVVLDHAGNCLRHGLAEEPREWSLEGRAKQKRDPEAELETRQCEKCYAIYLGTVCPQCGNVRVSKKRELEIAAEELQRLEAVKRERTPLTPGKCRTLADFQAYAKMHGHRPGWAWYRHQDFLRKKFSTVKI